MTTKRPVNSHHRLWLAALLVGASSALGACTHTSQEVTASIPTDYRLRHPIVIEEANQNVEIFVGNVRGGLSASQRADVVALAGAWLREGTGIIYIDVPSRTPNSRTAADSLREIKSLLARSGVPSNGISVHNYRTAEPQQFATIRLRYPRIKADAGPCGLWPEDIGPSIKNKSYLENGPYYNFGCASQRNLAAMSIEMAFRKVSVEIGAQSVALAEEFTLTTAELSYLQDRKVAYENLAKRTGLDGVKSVCLALQQSERYGTPLGTALRVMAQENRDMRMSAAEKKAAALPPKLTVPMILFFLPVLFVVILGPTGIKLTALH